MRRCTAPVGDNWELAVFGHPGRLSFTGFSQPWLARAAKACAGEELPRHRGRGGNKVREKINALTRLSENLRESVSPRGGQVRR